MTEPGTNLEAARQEFYERIAGSHLTPLWSVLHDLVAPEPRSEMAACLWRWEEIRPFLLEAGGLITAKEAIRRALILENPSWPGESRITSTLYAALQLILPGEIAPSHRHSQSALRFVMEGAGAFTAVDGEKTIMQVGDFVITPTWTWHDHGNDSDKPMIWLDGLDIPIVYYMNASFAEQLDVDAQPLRRPAGDSPARYGSGLLPVDYEPANPRVSPVFNYPYARTREALEQLSKTDEWDPCHGIKLKYVNPATGDYAMPTISTFMQLLPKGFETTPYRSSDATVFVAVEGKGHSIIEGERFDWDPKDIFVLPTWKWVTHHVDEESVIFSYSDRVIQQKLSLWREQRGSEGEASTGL